MSFLWNQYNRYKHMHSNWKLVNDDRKFEMCLFKTNDLGYSLITSQVNEIYLNSTRINFFSNTLNFTTCSFFVFSKKISTFSKREILPVCSVKMNFDKKAYKIELICMGIFYLFLLHQEQNKCNKNMRTCDARKRIFFAVFNFI